LPKGLVHIYRAKNFPHLHQLAIWYKLMLHHPPPLIDLNNHLSPLVNVEGATSISTILLLDVDVGSFSAYKYVPTHSAKHTKTNVRGAPSLGNPSCSKLDFSPPVAVAAALPDVIDPLSTARKPKVSSPSSPLIPYALGSSNRGL